MSALYGTYARSDLAFERGEGVRLFAQDGTPYLDFHSGIAVSAMGHGDPHLVAALKAAADKVWHTSNVFTIPEQERLGQRLVDATFADSVFFTNSGAEAIECAIKTARHYFFAKGQPDRYELICFTGSFHGRTLGTIAAGGNPSYLEGFGPPLPGFVHLAPGNLHAIEQAIGPHTCAVLIEPVQGEGGVTAMTADFMRGLRELCDRHGLLLILDEVQCGYGRTGKFFAHEWSGIAPDIMAVAKGIGGGFPLGACLATAAASAGMTTGTHATTFGGNPLAMAVGNAVLDIVLADGFLEHVRRIGLNLKQKLAAIVDSHPDLVEGIRGEGLMLGIKCRVPNSEVTAAARSEGLLLVPAGDNVVRMLPPLIVGEDEVDAAMQRLDAALGGLTRRAAAE